MNCKSEKGVALMAAMVFMVILVGFATTLMVEAGRRSAETSDIGASYEAMNAAQSAAGIAVGKLIASAGADGCIAMAQADWALDPANPADCPEPDDLDALGVTPLRLGQAHVYAWTSPRDAALPADKPSTHTLFAGAWVEVPGRPPVVTVLRGVVKIDPDPRSYNPIQGPLGSGGLNPLLIKDGRTDSWSSSAGAYGGGNVGSEGNVVSNGGIGLSGNAIVDGDAITGAAYGVQLTDNAVVTGEKIDDAPKTEYPPVVDKGPTFAADNDNASIGKDTLTLTGNNTYTLPSGNYYFDELKVTSNFPLIIQTPCKIYVRGNCQVTGNGAILIAGTEGVELFLNSGCNIAGNGVANSTGTSKPADFVMYSHANAQMKVTGNGNMYGVVYAPNAPVSIAGNGDIYGAFVGESIVVEGNGKAHFDEDLPPSLINPGYLDMSALPPIPPKAIPKVWSRLR